MTIKEEIQLQTTYFLGAFMLYKMKQKLKNSKATSSLYYKLKNKKDRIRQKSKLASKYRFINRSNDAKVLCIVLAGYKEYLYDNVFERIKRFKLPDMDICIISSGKYCNTLEAICEENKWSYLSTYKNDVSLAQNIAISIFPKADYIFKLDEDIFITKDYFKKMIRAYNHANDGDYYPGVIAPLILINGYSYVRIVNKLGLKRTYEQKFGELRYAAGNNQPIEKDASVARFMWGENNYIPQLDLLNTIFSNEPLLETACPIRFSIGAIMFKRQLWEEMDYYDVSHDKRNMLGKDEEKLCKYCCLFSKPIMVSDNIVVGHLSFGLQNEEMKEFYNMHKEQFQIRDQ